jgi:hypothetical protein
MYAKQEETHEHRRLAGALERFNRKERNLLVRAILGHGKQPLHLAKPFRDQVQVACKLDLGCISEDAWWGTDYHISWLAGALAFLVKGKAAVFRRRDDKCLPPYCNPLKPEVPKEGSLLATQTAAIAYHRSTNTQD